jgi:hypothetical protein
VRGLSLLCPHAAVSVATIMSASTTTAAVTAVTADIVTSFHILLSVIIK